MTVFIGRKHLVSDAFASLTGIEDAVVWEVVGVHGIGKSTFLERVREEAENCPAPPTILAVDMTEHGMDDSFRGDYGPAASAAVLWETFVRSRELLLHAVDHLADRLHSDDFDEFRQTCEAQGKAADAFLAGHNFRAISRESDPSSIEDRAVKARIREFQHAVDRAFIDAWVEFTARRRVLLTLDAFDTVAGNQLGRWLVELTLQLPRTLTLLARLPSSTAHAAGHPQLTRQELTGFTCEEVEEYLTRYLGEPVRPGVAQTVHEYTDGHPGGTALAGKLILERGNDIGARALRRLLDRLPDDPQQRWSTLVRLIVDAVEDPTLRRAVPAASVALSFDEPLLAALLHSDGEEGAGREIKALAEYRLAQPLRDGVRSNRFRLVEFIRLALAEDLRIHHATSWQRLHERAATYYFALLQDEEPGEAGTYGQWYRYERAEWQANKRDWLYHSGLLPERRELTRARFVLVFLEAFWWWGLYERFAFNHRLLEDWERAIRQWGTDPSSGTTAQDQQLADALWFLLDNYPLGHVKAASAPWDEMRSRLQLVEGLCGLTPGARRPSDAQQRAELARTSAIIRVFLAHTRRYRDPHDPVADRYYREAIRTFEKLDDQWVVAWLQFETADLALERGRPAEASSLIRTSATSARALSAAGQEDTDDPFDLALDGDAGGDWDHELLANLHRARADAHWLDGEWDPAAAAYGRAVTHAYWFQGRPHPPDSYTARFYAEVTERAAGRLLALAARDPEQAAVFATVLAAELPGGGTSPPAVAVLLQAREVDAVRQALFPRAPDPVTELRTDDSAFMSQWRLLWEERSDFVALLDRLADAG